MDWTSVFAESGDEELTLQSFLPNTHQLVQSRLARLVSVVYYEEDDKHSDTEKGVIHALSSRQEHSNYSLSALYFLSINYILGVGCLGVPYAFARSGLILGSVLIIIVSVISFITVMWVAESGERAEYLNELGILNNNLTNNGEISENNDGNHDPKNKSADSHIDENTSLLQRNSLSGSSSTLNKEDNHFEVIELISHFLGPIHQLTYQISLMGLMYVGLLAYSQVFTGAISALLPDHIPAYFSTVIFSVIVIPLSCIELDEQVGIQAFMAIIRFLAIFVMVGGSLMALSLNDSGEDGRRDNFPYLAQPVLNEMSYTANFKGFGISFSTALFSQLFQHSVPGLLRPLADGKIDNTTNKSLRGDINNVKSNVPRVFAAALFTTLSLYLILGFSAASYFGAETQPSVNLNFAGFDFGLKNLDQVLSDEKEISFGSLWVILIVIGSNLVVFFPALDTLSVFPLIANTLGNNLLASVGNASSSLPLWIDENFLSINLIARAFKVEEITPTTATKANRLYKAGRIATVFFRLVASIPPLILSLYATDLSFSLQLAGICGLYVAFFAPALLQFESKKRLRGKIIKASKKLYTGWWSSEILCIPVILFAIFSLVDVVLGILGIM